MRSSGHDIGLEGLPERRHQGIEVEAGLRLIRDLGVLDLQVGTLLDEAVKAHAVQAAEDQLGRSHDAPNPLNLGQGAPFVDVAGANVVQGWLALGCHQDVAPALGRLLQRRQRGLATDRKRRQRLREQHRFPKRDQGQ